MTLAVAAAAATACVDHEANAAAFCRAIEGVVDEARDGEELDAEQTREVSDDVALAMRDAEDATRDVRSAARDMSVAYDDLAALLDDDDAADDEIDELRAELRTARRDVRRACRTSTDG